MEAMLNFIPAPVALVLMALGFVSLAVGAIRLGYKQYVKQWALELVTLAEKASWAAARVPRKRHRSLPRCAAHCRTG